MTIVPAKTGATTSISKVRSGVSGLAWTVLFVLLALTWGCSGIVSGKSAQTTAPLGQTFGISGAISPAAGGGGATVILSGAGRGPATAGRAGHPSFSGLTDVVSRDCPGHGVLGVSPVN